MDGGRRRLKTRFLTAMAVALLLPPGARAAENLKFEPDFNLFSVRQDVQLGKEGAAQVDSTLPLLTDPQAVRYLNDLGRLLASLAPNNNAAYVWTFTILIARTLMLLLFRGVTFM